MKRKNQATAWKQYLGLGLFLQNRPFYSCVLTCSNMAMNASEALKQTSLFFSFKCQLLSIRSTRFIQQKQSRCHSSTKSLRRQLYTRFQCYVHRRHLRLSFDMPSFDMLCNLAHFKMLTQRTLSRLNSTFSHKRWIYLTSN